MATQPPSPPIIEPGGAIISNIGALPGASFSSVVSPRADFMHALSRWWLTPAMPNLWAIHFNMPSLLTDDNMNFWNEQITQSKWGIDSGIQTLFSPYTTKYSGCIFAQSVEIPGELLEVGYAGPNNRGFTYSPYVKKRMEPDRFSIEILETNVSYTDTIIKPWLVLAAHYGLIARDNGDNTNSIKADLEVWEMAKTGDFSADIARRKVHFFKNCIPFRVDPYTKNYSPDTKLETRKSQWLYTRYQTVQSS